MKEGESKARSNNPVYYNVYDSVNNYLDPKEQDIEITE
jgi:hypothetical protein